MNLMDKVFGYTCIRDNSEKVDYQISLLKSAGVKEENIFSDKKNKNKMDYTKYHKMKQMLSHGDRVVFCNMDKIGVNIEQIYDELGWYRERGVKVKILELQVLNSAGLDDELVQSIVIEICYCLSQIEKSRLRRRQAYGIQRAKEAGKYKGRKKKTIEGFAEVKKMIDSKEISVLEGCRRLGINSSTYYRRINKNNRN